ncbi:hypothetical protein ABPG72_003906 [Tetrahymena utriculariae]
MNDCESNSQKDIYSFFREDELENLKVLKRVTPIFRVENIDFIPNLFDFLNSLPSLKAVVLIILKNVFDDQSLQSLFVGISKLNGDRLDNLELLAEGETLNSNLLQFTTQMNKFPNLTSFKMNLFNNQLGVSSNALVNNLQNFAHLKKLFLNFGFTGLGSVEIKSLGKVLRKLTFLEKLTVVTIDSNCQDIGAWFQFCQGIEALHNLKSLFLLMDRSNISHEVGAMIASSYKELIQLRKLKLWLRLNEIKTDTALLFANAFQKLVNLQELDLQLDHNLILDRLAFKIARFMIVSSYQTSTSLFMEGEAEDIGGTTEATLDKIDEILDNFGYDMKKKIFQQIAYQKRISDLIQNLPCLQKLDLLF